MRSRASSPDLPHQANWLPAYDAQSLVLYVNISQVFRIFIIPFYRAPVTLTTVLKLKQGSNKKYYIVSQNDLYQVNEFVKFFTWPFGFLFVLAWQFAATLVCLGAALAFWPISWAEEHGSEVRHDARGDVARVEQRLKHTLIDAKGNGDLMTAPVTSPG